MTKTEVISLSNTNSESEQHNQYLVMLNNKAKDEYYVTIYPETIVVRDSPNVFIKDKKTIKLVINELNNYLSDTIAITNDIAELVECRVTSLKIDRLRLREIMRK